MRILPTLVTAMLAVATPLAAEPQWPVRTLRIVTGTPAGGSPDFVSRLLAEKLGERLGQAVVVENSANTGVAAWNTVAKSPPGRASHLHAHRRVFRARGSRQVAAVRSDQGCHLRYAGLRLS